MLELEELGSKIGIIGCSSSGKSMLAAMLSRIKDSITHLDLLVHDHDPNWCRKARHHTLCFRSDFRYRSKINLLFCCDCTERGRV